MAYKNRYCFVLKSNNYKDADKIFTLYTDKDGLISAIARGVRKISSKRSGSLDRLNLVNLSYYQSSSGHKTITEVENVYSFRNIKADPKLTETSYKIVHLLLKNLEEESANQVLFDLIKRTFFLLNEEDVNADSVYAYFVLNFVEILGYKLSLDFCVLCKRSLNNSWEGSGFNYDLGGLVCESCRTFEPAIELKAAALLAKAKKLKKKDLRFYKSRNKYVKTHSHILDRYLDFKLNN